MKKVPTIEQVRAAAELACFYVNSSGDYYRMNYCEDDYFYVTDEDSGTDHIVFYEAAIEGHFEQLVAIEY